MSFHGNCLIRRPFLVSSGDSFFEMSNPDFCKNKKKCSKKFSAEITLQAVLYCQLIVASSRIKDNIKKMF